MSNDPGAWWSTFSKENSILNQFLFPAPPPSYSWSSFPGELVCIVGRQGNVVPCTIMPGFGVSNDKSKQDGQLDPASVLVIYCHANGEDIGVLNEAGHWLSDTLGVHVLIPEYPGYGMAPGRPNELSVNSNIEAAYEFAVNGLHWDPKSIILFGRSIGTGPAIKLAAERECGGVILVSPYTSVKDMVSKHAGFLTSWLTAELANMFPSEDTIGRVQCPTLIVHGATDRVIPSDQAMRLHAASKQKQKRLVILESIGHHGIDLHFAVAHESPRLFALNGCPKVLNLDQFLGDPSLQGDTVASPVPAFDLRSLSWSRPSMEPGSVPFLRDRKASQQVSAQSQKHAAYWEMLQSDSRIVTDEVLLARISRDGLEDEIRFFEQAQRKPPGVAEEASKGVASPETNRAHVAYRTDEKGAVVEVESASPYRGGAGGDGARSMVPPPSTQDKKLFLY